MPSVISVINFGGSGESGESGNVEDYPKALCLGVSSDVKANNSWGGVQPGHPFTTAKRRKNPLPGEELAKNFRPGQQAVRSVQRSMSV